MIRIASMTNFMLGMKSSPDRWAIDRGEEKPVENSVHGGEA